LLKNRIARNAASLYAVQACRKLVPLFIIPYLARVLGPSGWGDVAFAQSMGDLIAILAEFGFVLSATREIAQTRDNPESCGRVASGTFGAQAVLTLLAVAAALAVATQIPLLRSHPKLLCAGLVYGAAQGISPLWLFQGFERMTLAASLEVPTKACALVAMFFFVHKPADDWKVLAFQSFTPIVTFLAGLWLAHRVLTLRVPTFALVGRALRAGWPMFVLRSGMATYGTANVLILGMFAPAPIVGYYASAEKLSKAIAGLLLPIREAFYPRLSHLAAHSPRENERLTRISAVIEGGCGLLLAVITWFGAGLFIRLIFGPTFAGAVPMLQILAALPFIMAFADAVGFQSLLPAGKEALVMKAIVTGGLVNLALAFVLAPRYQGTGMAISVVLAETAVCGVLLCIVAQTTRFFRKQETGSSDDTPILIDLTPRRIQ
jgi:polysaccharide transporter, PST family